jgi:hypothetical protein
MAVGVPTQSQSRNRRLAISGVLVFAAFLARTVLTRSGPAGALVEWLPIAVVAGTIAWSALSVRRNFPGAWGRPMPAPVLDRWSPARVVAINGMLAGMAAAFSVAGGRLPGAGWLVYWVGALPIMVAVALDRRWGIVAYAAATFVIAATFTPRAGLAFALFTGLLGVVSGAAAATRRSWLTAAILCSAALAPGLVGLVMLVPGFPVFWLHPNPHTGHGLTYLLLAAVVWGFSWTMTAMLLYRPIVRALGRRAFR